jgi:DNA-binding response OmpR family regulator
MVTARVEELDELVGLDVGADDYIKKPFSPRVLIARIQARLRQRGKKPIQHDGLALHPDRMEVVNHGEKVHLTVTQFNILYTLAHDPGRVFTRDEILEYAYDQALPPDVMDRTVDAHIKSIRKAIEVDARHPQRILTVIGKGYKFNDEL